MQLKRVRKVLGITLMGSSLLLGALTPLAASAAEGEEVPEQTTGFTLGSEEIPRMGFWNSDPSDYGDNAVTKQYPPEAVCLVQPQFCNFPEGEDDPSGDLELGGTLNDTNEQINDGSQELQGEVQGNDPGPPEDPVPPDTLPVSVAFGQKNYRSAIEFPLPDVPEGEEVEEFVVLLEQGNPTYSNSSPALRQAVLAALTCARDCDQDEFEKVVTEDCQEETSGTPCPREESPLLVEMCPIVDGRETDFDDTDWEGERAQPEETFPAVDCLFGDLGTPIPGVQITRPDGSEAEVTLWSFDLTFAMQAWNSGDIPYAGVALRPGAAENLAYGDPDPSFSKQVTFANAVYYASTTAEPAPPLQTFNPGTSTPSSGASGSTGSTGSTSSEGGELFGTPPTPASNSPIADDAVAPQPETSQEQPAVAEQPQTAQPQPQAGEQPQTLAANAPLGQPESPWWTWLLVVPFLGGAFLLQQSLAEQVAVATDRSGAMTRLLERQAAEREPDLVSN